MLKIKTYLKESSALLLNTSSFTLNMLSFLLLSQIILRQGPTILNAIPFVLFYAFRRSVLFLLAGYKVQIEPLLVIGYCVSIAGAIIGIFGSYWAVFWDIGAIGIGIGSALVPPAVRALNQRIKNNAIKSKRLVMLMQFPLLIVLLVIIAFLGQKYIYISFIVYAFYLILGLLGAIASPVWEPVRAVNWKKLELNYLNIVITLLLFADILSLRVIRNEGNLAALLLSILGILIILPVIFGYTLRRGFDKQLRIPRFLYIKASLRGMCIDFIAVYITMYIFLLPGNPDYAWVVAMYVLAPLLAGPIEKILQRILPGGLTGYVPYILILVGLLVIFQPVMLLVGVLLLRVAAVLINRSVNQELLEVDHLSEASIYHFAPRLLAVGGLAMQSVIWILFLTLSYAHRTSIAGLLYEYAHRKHASQFVGVINDVHIGISIIFALFVLVALSLEINHRKIES